MVWNLKTDMEKTITQNNRVGDSFFFCIKLLFLFQKKQITNIHQLYQYNIVTPPKETSSSQCWG